MTEIKEEDDKKEDESAFKASVQTDSNVHTP